MKNAFSGVVICAILSIFALAFTGSASAEDGAFVHVLTGRAQGRRVVFAFCESPDTGVELRFPYGFFERPVRDIVSGASVEVALSESGQALAPPMSPWGMAALAEAEA